MTAHQNPIAMVLAQPPQVAVVETRYEAGEPILPKQDGDFTFFLCNPIFTKSSRPFKEPDLPGPSAWDTDGFIPGRPAPGPCLVWWVKVLTAETIQKPKTPPLIL